MATYQKPTEDLIDFNSSVFKTANESTLTLSEATSLFLARVGTASSEAISTSFTNDIYVNTLRAGVGKFETDTNTCFGKDSLITTNSLGLNNTACGNSALKLQASGANCSAFGSGALATTTAEGNTAVGALAGNIISTGTKNTAVGSACLKFATNGSNNTGVGNGAGQTVGTGGNNTLLGYLAGGAVTGGGFNTLVGSNSNVGSGGVVNSTAIGAYSSVGVYSNSTAIGGGNNVTAGATCTAANQIMLGRTTETVECPGTANTISLKAATNISVNGMVFGTGSNGVGNGNIFIGQTSGTNGNGTTNTVVGHGAFTSAINTSSTGNTFIGSNAGKDITAQVTTCTIVGQGSYINTAAAYNGASCLGYDCQIGGANSTAIGTGAVTNGANQIVLGRSSETVYCPGTGTSLIATKNISVNGIQVGIGSEAIGNANIYIGLGSGGSGSSNTLIGRNSWSPNNVSGNSGNTIVGSQLGYNLSALASVSNNTVIGYNSYNTASQVAYNNVCSIGVNNVVGGNQTSLLGTSTTASAANSTAVGYGANASVSNQIMLGTSTEFVECSGTNTTNGCLKLNGGLKLQTAYGAVPSATMLGYRIALSAIAITSFTSGTSQTIGSLALTVGVWSLNYTFELLADAAVSTTQQAFFFSNQSGSAATYATRINNTGTTRFHSAITYANNDRPAYSGGGTYYASADITLYPAINITFSTGALTGTGYASAVRIG